MLTWWRGERMMQESVDLTKVQGRTRTVAVNTPDGWFAGRAGQPGGWRHGGNFGTHTLSELREAQVST